MNILDYAKTELNRILATCEDDDSRKMQKAMNKSILKCVKLFAKQRHSGSGASYSISLLTRLLEIKPLTPLTGEDSEWRDISEMAGEPMEQNLRCFAVFRRKHDNRTAFYSDGKIFSSDGGKSWFTSKDSQIHVNFPFTVPAEPQKVMLRSKRTGKKL